MMVEKLEQYEILKNSKYPLGCNTNNAELFENIKNTLAERKQIS